MSQTLPPEQSNLAIEHNAGEPSVTPGSPAAPFKKRGFFSRMPSRVRVIIALVVIALAVVGAFFGPKEGESDNTTGDLAVTPTLVVTNVVGTTTLNQSFVMQEMRFNVTKAIEAQKFSDDREVHSAYIVRVMVTARNTTNAPVGVLYDKITTLTLPDGRNIAPRYISIPPSSLPKQTQSGFFDFPLSSPVPLNQLVMHVGSESIPLSS